jgi:hypothetical protein
MPDRDFDNRLERILEGDLNNKDIIILGTSRGESNILSSEIENHFNLKTFNLSYGGSSLTFQKYILEKYLKYNTNPKFIIKIIDDDFEFKNIARNGNVLEFRFDRLYPLTKYGEVRDKLIELGDKNVFLSELFVIHQLNLSSFNLKAKGVKKSIMDYGASNSYMHSNVKGTYKKLEKDIYRSGNVKEEVEAFKEIQQLCAVNNIQLVYAVGPVYREINQIWLKDTEKIINHKENIFVFDTINEFYKKKEIYGDESHLNRIGATQFTKDIINFIEKNEIFRD